MLCRSGLRQAQGTMEPMGRAARRSRPHLELTPLQKMALEKEKVEVRVMTTSQGDCFAARDDLAVSKPTRLEQGRMAWKNIEISGRNPSGAWRKLQV